ncbi:MAG: succinate dehydrogenase iron-sulfur subunit, partial [Phycisphaerales bacterium]|nr:succinate dehydrogenase iron-sulfur subunit [Phycisphaerales bacterium]
MVANANDTSAKRPLTVRIKRQDTPDGTPRWEEFRVEVATDANVISVL